MSDRQTGAKYYRSSDQSQAQIKADRSGKPLELAVDEMIHQMREERTEQIMQACFPESEPHL